MLYFVVAEIVGGKTSAVLDHALEIELHAQC